MAGWATLYQIDRISIRGGIGTGILMALVVAGVVESLPVLRWPLVGGTTVGLLIAGGSISARRQRPLDARTPPLSLGLYEDRRRPR
jgi:hypothetical protein